MKVRIEIGGSFWRSAILNLAIVQEIQEKGRADLAPELTCSWLSTKFKENRKTHQKILKQKNMQIVLHTCQVSTRNNFICAMCEKAKIDALKKTDLVVLHRLATDFVLFAQSTNCFISLLNFAYIANCNLSVCYF